MLPGDVQGARSVAIRPAHACLALQTARCWHSATTRERSTGTTVRARWITSTILPPYLWDDNLMVDSVRRCDRSLGLQPHEHVFLFERHVSFITIYFNPCSSSLLGATPSMMQFSTHDPQTFLLCTQYFVCCVLSKVQELQVGDTEAFATQGASPNRRQACQL